MTVDKLKMHSLDLTRRNIDAIAERFPTVVTESLDGDGNSVRAIDFDALRQELSDHIVEGPQERYQLDWPGKRAAAFAANAPIAKTLRPVREESVDFDTTRNLFIEGDNLDALKLLQESYLGKVKLIYIDPPYNTGNDFIYEDDFAESSAAYLERSGQRSEYGERLVANTEANGRFHSDWLSMMYPRLKLARNLMRDDGIIMASIDDWEQSSLRRIMDEIFGRQNFIAQLVWEKGRKNDAKFFSVGHEYMLVYARSLPHLRDIGSRWREEKPGAREIWDEYLRLRHRHGGDHAAIEKDLSAWFSALQKGDPSKKWARYKRVDSKGPWRDRDISWPGGDGPRYDVIHPRTGEPCKVPERGWIYGNPDEMQRQIALGLVEFREDHTEPPFRKAHLRPTAEEDAHVLVEGTGETADDIELATQVRGSVLYKQSQVSVKHLRELMGAKVFPNPKDHAELARLFEYVLDGREGVVMDFFAGSGTTAESVFQLCAGTGLNCPVVLVQLPEDLDTNIKEATGSAKTTIKSARTYLDERGRPHHLSELTKIRVREAGQRVLGDRKENRWNGDTGFRTMVVDTTNMVDTNTSADALGQGSLNAMIDSVKPDRTDEDLLFQVLLDWGLDLSLPITRVFEREREREIFRVADDALIACFSEEVSADVVAAIAKSQPLRAVFRDSAFKSDADRINAEQLFRELSPNTEVKTI